MSRFDVAIFGAGILGLATARELVRREPALVNEIIAVSRREHTS